MGKEVNLNSSEWTDMIFEGKNKKYGAYFLRQTSSKRHIVAFIVVVVFVGIVSATPLLVEAVKKQQQENLGGVDEAFELANLDNKIEEQVPEENIIRQETAPPPPPLKATIQFTPPVITDDEEVTDENAMKSQEELTESKVQISVATVDGTDDKDAVDIADLKDHKVIVAEKEEEPFVSVEQMPQFPGGNTELMKYIANNLKYPTIAAENGIEGRVIVRFVVGKDGRVSNIEIQRGLDSSCDKEARRVVESMPRWTPGRQNGREVPVYFTLPILFKLQK